MQEKDIKILIADDDESIRTTLEFVLQEQNFNVESVSNGKEALKKVKEQFFNITIVDYKLPDMTNRIIRIRRDLAPDININNIDIFIKFVFRDVIKLLKNEAD